MNSKIKLVILLCAFLTFTLVISYSFLKTNGIDDLIVPRQNYIDDNYEVNNIERKTEGNQQIEQNQQRAPRIFCMILTSNKNLKTRVKLVYDKWAHKCDMHKFIMVIPNEMHQDSQVHSDGAIEYQNGYHILQPPKLNSTTDKYDKLTDKMFLSMQYISKKYHDFDWYLKADDDTYILVDNLKDFLYTKNASQPVTYGYDFKVIVDYGYHSGGGSYVLSREAISRVQKKLDTDYKSCPNTGTEDVDVARCLRLLGVYPNKSIDEQGRERFHPLDLLGHYYGHYPDWLYGYASNPVQKVCFILFIKNFIEYNIFPSFKGLNCCSDTSISFHYMDDNQFVKLYNILNKYEKQPKPKNHLIFKDIVDQML